VGRVLPSGEGPGDSLLIADAAGVRHTIDPRTATLERSAGYRRHTLLGLGLGSLAGLGAGALLVSGCKGPSDDELCGLQYLYAVPTGAAIGALIGALTRTDRWETVSGGPTTSLGVWPLPGRTMLGLTIRY
jgi:hypothetical protein